MTSTFRQVRWPVLAAVVVHVALLGVYVVDCPTLEDVIETARQMKRDESGTFEIRPLRYFDPGAPPK